MPNLYAAFIKELARYDIDGDKKITSALVPCGSPEESLATLKKQRAELQEFGFIKTLACASEEYNKVIARIQDLFAVSKQVAFIILGILDHLDGVPGEGVRVDASALEKYALPRFLKELDATMTRIHTKTAGLSSFKIPLKDWDALEAKPAELIDELKRFRFLINT